MRKYLFYCSEKYAVGILKPIQREIQKRGETIKWFFDGPGSELLTTEDHQLKSIDEIRRYNPEVVILPGDRVPHFIPGVKVEVFHGFDAGKPRHIHIRGFFDIYCTTGPDMTKAFQKIQNSRQDFLVYETGWPKFDPLYDGSLKFQKRYHDGKPVILYHSTFSPSWSAAPILYDELKRMMASNKAWNWIITFHPKMNPAIVQKYKALVSENVFFAETENIHELQQQADVMVSDTSSAVVEFALQNKPVITFRNRIPKTYMLNISEVSMLEGAIHQALLRPKELLDEIKSLQLQTHPYTDGKSSLRVLLAIDDFLENNKAQKLKAKPLNFWRKLKMRKRLGYWKI